MSLNRHCRSAWPLVWRSARADAVRLFFKTDLWRSARADAVQNQLIKQVINHLELITGFNQTC
jgi:ribosome modulation factor